MGFIIFFFASIAIISFLTAWATYRKLKKKGRNPWVWTIIVFIITGLLVYGTFVLYFLLTWER